jgi:hypothetical protein
MNAPRASQGYAEGLRAYTIVFFAILSGLRAL